MSKRFLTTSLLIGGFVLLALTFVPAAQFEATPLTATPAPTSLPGDYPTGSVLMVGHWANTPVASTTALIAEYQPGGIVIMSAPEDPAAIRDWVTTWQAASTYPLIIAIDQEGGSVSRLRGAGFSTTTQRTIATASEAHALGRKRGEELAALGITMNFAPVLDTATTTDSFLYERTFSNPKTASILAAAMTKGMAERGVIAAAKHFPGHPDSPTDSHLELPRVAVTREALDTFTTPFRNYITDANPKAIMTAHVAFPNIDPAPATLSRFFLTMYLRQELGFTGVIITDDLSMQAVTNSYTPAEAAVKSILAGSDLILLAADPTLIETVLPTLEARAASDTRFHLKLTSAQQRIYQLQRDLDE